MNTFAKPRHFLLFVAFIWCTFNAFGQENSQKIYDIIEKKREFNKNHKNSVVFKIQIYNGFESEADEIKQEFQTKYEQYKVQLTYDPPEWKTQVIGFKTRLDADRALLIIREDYTNAIVLEEKI